MRRRALLQGLAGVALVPPLRSRSAEGRPGPRRIVVVGAGIVGAALSYRLAKRGADVTLFEHAETGAGATGKSFAWLNAHHSKQPRHYHELSRAGLLAWHALEHELGGLEIQWNGSLEWYPESPAARAA